MSEEIKKYDERGNIIYIKWSGIFDSVESWRVYDENNNVIYYKRSGCDKSWNESWSEYDGNRNQIHYRNDKGYEKWWKYNKNDDRIEIAKIEFEKIKEKEYLSRTKCSRFELMEI